MVEETGDGHGADAADDGGNGGEISAGANICGKVAFQDAILGGGAGIDDASAWGNHRGSDETGDAGGGNDEIIIS